MDVKRLEEARRLLGKMNPLDGSDWADALDIAERAIDEAISRQTTTCPDCNGSGAYQEYHDEFDRYTVHSCATCDGSGEIARQSATSEEVRINPYVEQYQLRPSAQSRRPVTMTERGKLNDVN